MYELEIQTKFKKDLKLAKKRGLKIGNLDTVIKLLMKDGKLPSKYKPHRLSGIYNRYWECHIQPDWLLIWDQDDTIKLISLIRTGTHSDLFK